MTRTLSQGLAGADVQLVQERLVELGFDPGVIDGVTGRRTRSAVLAFQEKHGLPQTGELDAVTEARLIAVAFPAAGAPA